MKGEIMKKLLMLVFIVLSIMAVSGCTDKDDYAPTMIPTVPPTPSPTVTATAIPTPTLIGGSDEAHIAFSYSYMATKEYRGLTANPGYKLYVLDVSVSSDKPVETSADWFSIDYRRNASESIKTYYPITSKYPSFTMGPTTGPVEGWLLFELPDSNDGQYSLQPVYTAPKNFIFKGPYKVYGKVYGVRGIM